MNPPATPHQAVVSLAKRQMDGCDFSPPCHCPLIPGPSPPGCEGSEVVFSAAVWTGVNSGRDGDTAFVSNRLVLVSCRLTFVCGLCCICCDVLGKQHFGKGTVAVTRKQVARSLADAVSPLERSPSSSRSKWDHPFHHGRDGDTAFVSNRLVLVSCRLPFICGLCCICRDVSGKQHFGKGTVAVTRGQVARSLADAVSPLSVFRALLCNPYRVKPSGIVGDGMTGVALI